MRGSDAFLPKSKKISPEEKLKHFKNVVKSVMYDALKALALIELLAHDTEMEEQISLLDHYLDYTRRLCESGEAKNNILVFPDI